MIFVDEAGASLVDITSTNATFVNGDRVPATDLRATLCAWVRHA